MNQLIGEKAPSFNVMGVSEKGEIQQYCLEDFEGQYVVLFFYPLDFTFVCPLELLSMSALIPRFKEQNAVVLGVSVDSEHTHSAWRNTDIKDGGIGQLQFPLLADIDREMMLSYGVMNNSPNIALRGTIIIDPKGLVRIQHINDLPIGRNPDEILRLVAAIDFHEKHGDVCPPKWEQGSKSLKATREGLVEYQES
jgi:peroxiredoxin (alkyl hydroperoxide reductase subunit C)